MKQKTAIITGASRGIGKAIAIQLAEAGMQVALLARNAEELDGLKIIIEAKGGKVLALPTDIADEQAIQNALEQTWNTWGRIDLLVNNAGIGTFKPIAETSLEDWNKVMDTNAKGTFLMTKAVIPYMKQQNSGHIITIASDVAKRTFAYGGIYCASKYAQDALMMAVRQEVHQWGVKVSTIYPGLTETYFAGQQPNKEAPNLERLQPTDIAEAVCYIYNTPPQVVIDELYLHPFAQKYWLNP